MTGKSSTVKETVKENRMYIWAFLLPFCAMLVIFIGNRIYPFGDRSFLHVDMYHQYFPFLVELFHKVKEGENLSYCWNAGIGSNFVALYAYYLASPLNWLCLLVPERFLMEFISYFVVIKTGLCGLTAAVYLSRHFDTKKMSVVLFSTFYAMSGFMAAYNWNVMWLDCIVLAPLIILGLEKLVSEGKYRMYCICLGLAILSNYYICIMICLYLVLYFFIVLLPFAEKKMKAFLNFAWASLLAGGMGALLLIPEALALQLSKFSSASFPKTLKTYFSIFDMLARHFMDVAVETGLDHWPNLYCSVAVLILVPVFLLSKKISVKEKFTKFLLVLLLFVSFASNQLNFIWHGFNYPDSLPARQSFLYILLILTVSYEAFLHLKDLSKQEYTCIFTGLVIFLILSQKLITDDAVTDVTYILTVIFLICYGILIYLYVKQERLEKLLIRLAVFAVFVESGCNMLLTSVPTVSRPNYLENYDVYHTLREEQAKEDTEQFYRYDKKNRMTNNDSMLQNFPSVSMFSSTTNSLVNHFYGRYGMRTSKVFYCSHGMTPFMSSLLSVGYTFGDESLEGDPLYSLREKDGDVCLYQNKYSLPLGFCISPDETVKDFLIEDEQTAFDVIKEGGEDDLLPVDNQNRLAQRLGAQDDIFERISCENGDGETAFTVPRNGNVYVYFDQKLKEITPYINGVEGEPFKKLSNRYILDLGYQSAGTGVVLKTEEDDFLYGDVYLLKEEPLADLINSLGEQTMEIQTMESDHILANLRADDDGYLILSMPYDPGFQVKVDGVKTEIQLFEEMMMAVPVTAGQHQIEITYHVRGMGAGFAVSICSIGIFIGIVLLEKRKNRKAK